MAVDEQALKDFICKKFLGGDASFPIEADTKLLDEGICDSLGLVQIATEIEKRCPGVRIRDQEITHSNFGSIAAIARFVGEKLKARG